MPEPNVPQLNEASVWASDIALVMFGGVRPNGRLTKTALCLLQGAPGAAQSWLTDVHQPASVTSSAAGPAPSKRELGLLHAPPPRAAWVVLERAQTVAAAPSRPGR
jgi:hypothetical protein